MKEGARGNMNVPADDQKAPIEQDRNKNKNAVLKQENKFR